MTASDPKTAPRTGATHVLLDVDGTLIDSMPGVRASFLSALDALGVAHPDEAFLAGIAGPPMEETLAAAGVAPERVAAGLAAYLDAYGRHGWLNCTAYPGLRALLARWRAAGLTVATATSKGERFARMVLERHGLLESIDFLGAAQEDGPRRTKEAVLAHTLDALGLNGPAAAGRAVLVGDRVHDFSAARAAGVVSVAVEWGYGGPAERALADFRVADAAELERTVRELTE